MGFRSKSNEDDRIVDFDVKLMKKIAGPTQLKTKDVKTMLGVLQTIACLKVKKIEKLVIRQLTTLKPEHKPALKTGKKMMLGKEVKVAKEKEEKGKTPSALVN